MQWPAQLLRRNKNAYKNQFGHVLVIAGSPSMLGAAALSGLAAMRAGAGLTTVAVPKSLNLTLQQKVSNVIMTLPLPETRAEGAISSKAFEVLKHSWCKYSAVAIGPGMSLAPGTVRFIEKIYCECPLSMVVDADALNALAGKLGRLGKPMGPRILTPHLGEMSRLSGLSAESIYADKRKAASNFVKLYQCVIVLKGHRTVVASPDGKAYVNDTGNSGMATAGTGDVLTGIIAALLAQGVTPFEAARFGVWWHGRAGDMALMHKTRYSLLAVDIIDSLSHGIKEFTTIH